MLDFEQKKREILDRITLPDLIAEHVTLKRSGRRLIGLCPFHAEKTPSFTVVPELGIFKCFGCGKGGDAFTFVQHRENVPFTEAMRILADRAGVQLAPAKPSADGKTAPGRSDLARVNAWALGFFRAKYRNEQAGRLARDYLGGRGFTDAIAERFGIGLATEAGPGVLSAGAKAGFAAPVLGAADLLRTGDEGRTYETFRQRLMFPIRDATQRVIGFGGRTLVDDKAKYINTRQTELFDKGRNLYGIDLARESMATRGRAIVVEGYTDCMACHQAGFTETVATLGTALTEHHVDLLRRYCDQVIFLFDSDQAGEAAADRAITVALPRCVQARLARIPDGKDPGEYLMRATVHDFTDVLNRSVDALEFKWLGTSRRYQADLGDGQRREAVMDFLAVLAEGFAASAVDAIQRGLMVNRVAHLLRLDRREVDRLLSKQLSRRTAGAGRPVSASPVPPPREDKGPIADQGAWERVLEVLLNRPEFVAEYALLPLLETVRDEKLRRIATFVVTFSMERRNDVLAAVLSRCDAPADAAFVAELARRGAERGNFESTLRLAIQRLIHSAQTSILEAERVAVLQGVGGAGQAELGLHSDVLCQGMREHKHFAPRRLIRESSKANENASTNGNVGTEISKVGTA